MSLFLERSESSSVCSGVKVAHAKLFRFYSWVNEVCLYANQLRFFDKSCASFLLIEV
jgi:hypothetical protein